MNTKTTLKLENHLLVLVNTGGGNFELRSYNPDGLWRVIFKGNEKELD
jgi:hypothetical protein